MTETNIVRLYYWLLFLALICYSFGETRLEKTQIVLKDLLNSKEFKNAVSDITLSRNEILKSLGRTDDNLACMNSVTKLLNDTGRLIQYADAAGKPHSSIFSGNLAWLGSFDSCQQEISDAKYCISKMNLIPKVVSGANNHTVFPVQWGGCFPKSCGPLELEEILNCSLSKLVNPKISKYFVISLNSTFCPVQPEYTTGAKITIALCGVVLLLCLLGTITDLIKGFTDNEFTAKKFKPTIQETVVKKIDTNDASSLSYIRDFNNPTTDETPLTPDNRKVYTKKKWHVKGLLDFFLCFSILRNTTKIFDTNVPSVAITCVNGMRVISMFWVILGHTFLFWFASSLMENPVHLLGDIRKFSMMVIANGYFSVDTFFFVSGLLLAYTAFRKLEKSEGRFNWALFYIHRYFRLTPSLMFTILFYAKLMPYLNYSPIWYKQNDKHCGQYWWTNLLYINNFYPTKFLNECLGWSWYLANDMQFFVITPLFLVATYRYGWRGLFSSAGSVLFVSTITIASIIGSFNIDPMALGRFDVQHLFSGKMKGEFENKVYIKPYCRIQPYLVGFFLGYYMHRSYSATKKPGWALATLCWLVAIATGMSLVYAPYNTIKVGGRQWSSAENIIYGAFERLLWGVVLAWVTYACHNGYGGLIQRFLSARFWIPLSRLTYSAYLVHPIVLTFIFSGAKSTTFYSFTTISYYYISAVVLAYGAAFILAVTIEFPCDNMENMAMKSSRKRS